MDWTKCPLVENKPRKVSGAAVLKDTRMQANSIIENYADGMGAHEIAEVFELPVNSVRTLLAYAVKENSALRQNGDNTRNARVAGIDTNVASSGTNRNWP